MVGNITADNNGDILVEFDYNNIIVVDPNKTIDDRGNIKERLVDHENLVMYVNLEADILPRTKLAVGGAPTDRYRTVSIAKMNFLKPTSEKYLDIRYYDQLTGYGATKNKDGKYQGINQGVVTQQLDPDGNTYTKRTVVDENNVLDNGLLGITQINITTNSSFVPAVTMELEDVQGKALFELGDNSPYAAFFNLPYPQFYLTVKGYYGQAIRYQLNLEKFNARFNSFSGNYQVSLEFRGYKFNILNEIAIGHLLATPHMYSQLFTTTSSVSTNSTQNNVTQITSERGYQKIREVYSEYKSKGLIPIDLPELTIAQLVNKLDNFENFIVNSYNEVDVIGLTNIRTYRSTLQSYYNRIRGTGGSWFNNNMDPSPIVLENGDFIYFFKNNLDEGKRETASSELLAIILEFNKSLDENPTLGKNGDSRIINTITLDSFLIDESISQIDWRQTTIRQTGNLNPTTDQVNEFRNKFNELLPKRYDENLNLIRPKFFIFEGKGRFDDKIKSLDTQSVKILSQYETRLSADLANKFEDKENGIGFKPTVRNMMAVIMASAEAFIRLLEEVHTNAWNVREDPVRKNAILYNPSSVKSSDSVNNVTVAQQFSELGVNVEDPVYPWPQFFVESLDDKRGRFQLTYIADPSVVNITQGYLYEKWPEVEFVEEYMRGLEKKFDNPWVEDSLSNQNYTNLININAIEFPQTGVAYLNKEEVKFFYEIWERQFLTSNYSGLVRQFNNRIDKIIELIVETEVNNIVTSLGNSSPFLTFKFKNFGFTAISYEDDVLRNFSNGGTGRAYQDFIRDFYVTRYIREITEVPFKILSTNELGLIPQTKLVSDGLETLTKNTNNEPIIVDTIPFTNPQWVSNNMAGSNSSSGFQVYNTSNSLKVYDELKVLSNFTDVFNYTDNRPVTNFSYTKIQSNILPQNNNLQSYFLKRNVNEFFPTEGFCTFTTPTNQLNIVKTTSMLNTPFFINAIQKGVENQKNNRPYPYIQAAYLFINSLPLATLKEKYKKIDNGVEKDLDYIASVFKKYGAIHKLPYAWVIKLGSIWYRYKKYVEDEVDILDDVWNSFNYKENFNPTNDDFSGYTFSYQNNPTTIKLQNTSNSETFQNIGFYPKLIDDFNYFYNGYVFYKNYTNEEIQNSVTLGMKLYNFGESNMTSVIYENTTFNQTTWSVVVPQLSFDLQIETDVCNSTNNTQQTNYFIIPSFGANINQGYVECVENRNSSNTSKVDLMNNQNIFDGSVRAFWAAPNYGYFDVEQSTKPNVNSYLNTFSPNSEQQPFKILSYDGYSRIEEIFSVFEKRILDQMELEFLNFSKSFTDVDDTNVTTGFGASIADMTATFRNFQLLFRNLMTVPSKGNKTEDEYFQSLISSQLENFSSGIKSFLNYDIILKNGNPSNYRRRIFDSYLSHNTATPRVVDPITFEPYVPNSLPSTNGTITLAGSISNNIEAWKTLQLEVGFSTIEGIEYTNNGSTITDFFIDNNIAFTSENIVLLAPIIKMYATQKSNPYNLNAQQFINKLIDYLNQTSDLQLNILNDILIRLNNVLPNQQQLPERTIQSVIDGQQSKIENYEMFKALNDKWIAGNDYVEKTLFEDMLFLDRASRNIGDVLIIDIFGMRDMFTEKALNPKMSVFTLISGILIKNNFTVMNLPAYVNFYNVQDTNSIEVTNPEGSLDFANNMWGTFLNVDYRNSSPKMVCFFVGKPSEYLDLPKHNFRFRTDGIELQRASENPLIENQEGKKDWTLSNKCVGFNVDIGTRNQNIFYSFSVSQDSGKATSESIQTQLHMVNQAGGNEVATQNVGLYNLYKSRSYQCSVVCLGNALIQPTMYFNLRHVPMFNGPYMITSVQHQISSGDFQTTFTGVRQGIFDLPLLDQILQQVNRNLLTKLEQIIRSRKDEIQLSSSTFNQQSTTVVQNPTNTAAEENSCNNQLSPKYANERGGRSYIVTKSNQTKLTTKALSDAINNKFPSNPITRAVIYAICYVRTYNGSGTFVGYGNNFATVSLDFDYGGASNFFSRKYCCVNLLPNKSKPVVEFETLDKFLEFMESRVTQNLQKIRNKGLLQFYVCDWPVTGNIKEENFSNNLGLFKDLEDNIYKSIQSAKDNGLLTAEEAIGFGVTIVDNNKKGKETPQATPTPSQPVPEVGQTCLPPLINSFSPITGTTGTIIQVNGSNFNFVKKISINDIVINYETIVVFNETTLRFSLPDTSFTKPYIGNIKIETEYGTATSVDLFTYI